jgi:hypothetical protein
MKILFITPRWLNGDIIGRPCHTENLVSSLAYYASTNPDITFDVEYISVNDIWSREQLDKVILESDADVILLSAVKHVTPSLEAVSVVKKRLSMLVWDTPSAVTKLRYLNLRLFLKNQQDFGVMKWDIPLIEYSKYSNILVIDNGYGEMFPNIYCIFEPVDYNLLYPIEEEEKIYDISFIGSTDIPERRWYKDQLDRSDIKVSWLGGRSDKDKFSTQAEWAEMHRKSKIELNFNGNVWLGNRKSRVWDIASCKNMMIATIPDVYTFHTGKWFIEGEHFAAINHKNFIDVIKFYLENDDVRKQIAANMHNFYMENYSTKKWWDNLISYTFDKE